MATKSWALKTFSGAAIGALVVLVTGCTSVPAAAGPSASESTRPTMPSSSVAVSASPTTPAFTSAPASPPAASPSLSLPPALAQFKSVDASPFRTPGIAAIPYSVLTVDGGLMLSYDTGRAKGQMEIPASAAEIAYISEPISQIWPARGVQVVWDTEHVVVVLVDQAPGQMGMTCFTGALPTMSWRILAAALDSDGKPGSFTQVATGRSSLVVQTPNFAFGAGSGCEAIWPPSVALSDGLMAYSVEQPRAGQPLGSQIVIRSLSDGAVIRDVAVPQYVYSLQLAGQDLVWIDYPGVTTSSLPMRISTAAIPAPQTLLVYSTPGDSGTMKWNVPPYVAGGHMLAWQASSAGSVQLRDLASGEIRQISPEGLVCQLEAFDGADVAMGCSDDLTQSAWDSDFAPEWFLFWSPGGGCRVVLVSVPGAGTSVWRFWNGALSLDFTEFSTGTGTVWTIPLSALTGA